MIKDLKSRDIIVGTLVILFAAIFFLFLAYLSNPREVIITQGNYSKYFEKSTQQVILFGNSTCHYCQSARDYLRARGIAFSDRNIDESQEAASQFKELNGNAVPLIIVGSEKIVGFHEQELTAMITRINTNDNAK